MLSEKQILEVLSRAVKRTCPAWLADRREDLVQKACLRIIGKLKGTEESDPLEASYLWKVAHSVVMDEIRHHRRHPEVALDNPAIAEPADNSFSPEKERSSTEMREAINDGLGLLSEPRRWAVLLYLYGFSLQDSATMLGWNTKRVDNQRYQGLAELRTWLKEKGFQP